MLVRLRADLNPSAIPGTFQCVCTFGLSGCSYDHKRTFQQRASSNSVVANPNLCMIPWKWMKSILNNAKWIDLHRTFASTQSHVPKS